MISGPRQSNDESKKPFRLRKSFHLSKLGATARLYASAYGIYEVEINGYRVGDHVLAPGFQSYQHRLHYQLHDVIRLLREGENVVGAYVAEGWYAGRLGRPSVSNIWGDRIGFLAQLECDGEVVCLTDSSWQWLAGPVQAASIYDGEHFDSNQDQTNGSIPGSAVTVKGSAEDLGFPSAALIAPEAPPARRIMEVKPVEMITTRSGKKVLDFGQNLVGWLRIEKQIEGKPGDKLWIRHAEVMERGELGVRPLRTAKAQSLVTLGGNVKGHETRFTFFGFRYAEINCPGSLSLNDFTAIVISSDLRRTGVFECSHKQINQLHQNTVWSMRGNFLSLPTDCLQRDERLGWTGDLQVFTPTANFLFDTSALLGEWLRDVEADQRDNNGVPPVIVPVIPKPPTHTEARPMAIWADCVILTPRDLYESFGDLAFLERQWESMCLWLDKGVPRDEHQLYAKTSPQYGDWLDPRAPPSLPGHGPTDCYLVANAYLIHVTRVAARIASMLGHSDAAEKYSSQASKMLDRFHEENVTPAGKLSSNSQTAYVLALHFELYPSAKQRQMACETLEHLTRWEAFKITTGFAGTPLILKTLADNDMLSLAYRMLQERDDPSWLYTVRMGATTIWERWNSMLPNGDINPGQMTSFNHYALGSVCDFLHGVVGGLSAETPGWKRALVRPRPGGSVTRASTSYDSPYGPYAVEWKCNGDRLSTTLSVPPNGEAHVILPGIDCVVGSGSHSWEAKWRPDPKWPPQPIQGAQGMILESVFVP
ncbi:uncharacterized protein LTR77_002804 [Saxophila tyrrhenica]|uniref:alpha-L-rhamnosidase n=1 Tax=Saxophila tyrrhenica TaxID=1690608 RepID=A0AAV9PIF0_9PEZI|nr:hypothetical protein LTR77_002804 [Saxophila tyrrhenica]